MEQRKVFLEKNKSINSVNAESFMNVELSAKTRLTPYNDVDEKLSLYQLYNDERDACERFRMVFTINPICSNVLFNTRTEIVKNEGSDDCEVIIGDETGDKGNAVNTTKFDWKQGIRDTEYSHADLYEDETPYVYHCGWDIFNNHMLRKDDFVYVSKVSGSTTDKQESEKVFNTINDYVRDFSGKTVKEAIVITNDNTGHTISRHLYQYDTILTMYDAFANRIQVKNGWYGFTNPGNIEIPNVEIKGKDDTKKVSINKLMNNNKPCEFIDMYPDRSLFSFVPKLNKYRHRAEKNWDYCITYPYKKDEEKLSEVLGLDSEMTEDSGKNAIKSIETKITTSNSGIEIIQIKSIFKHTLEAGGYVRLYYKNGDKLVRTSHKAKVVSVGTVSGEEKDRYFSIKLTDVSNIFDVEKSDNGKKLVVNIDGEKVDAELYYKKEDSGYECQYYFRVFKKLKKEVDGKELELASEINKLAYGENIYGDRFAEIVFTDDIDVTGLVDNNGRPVSEVYLTFIKRNKGHEKWYTEKKYGDEDVEFSHCFGEVTSGLDLPTDDGCRDYNVRRLHNVKIDDMTGNYKVNADTLWRDVLGTEIKPLEPDITINDDEFLGDIVEYNPVEAKETVIENVYHRFNTAQREECKNSDYYDIMYDRLDNDDYDAELKNSTNDAGGFVVTSGYVNTTEGFVTDTTGNGIYPGNINPEGYYYNPHFKIKIRQESDTLSEVTGKTIQYNPASATGAKKTFSFEGNPVLDERGETYECYKLSFINPTKKKYVIGDSLCFYDKVNKTTTWGYIDSVEEQNDGMYLGCIITDKGDGLAAKLNNKEVTIVSTDDGVATYATYLPNSNKFVWRSLVAPSEITQDSDLYDMPFSNGRFYKHENINFFLKRQDPRNEYKLLSPEKMNTALSGYKVWGYDKIDLSGVLYFYDSLLNVCY